MDLKAVKYDITILTDKRYVSPKTLDEYTNNVLLEDDLIKIALEDLGFQVTRTNWDNPLFDWNQTKYVLFRTTWDYFDRFSEFSNWLEKISEKTILINPKELIYWNIDKHYLKELQLKNIQIAPTLFIEPDKEIKLENLVNILSWDEMIMKPAVAGAARHTHRFNKNNIDAVRSIFNELIKDEAMLIQEFQKNIITQGERSLMIFDGTYSHAVLKSAKAGDFRVQDDFGGTVQDYTPNTDEIKFAESVVAAISPFPVYARVDIFTNNQGYLALGEVELIEPELWFRKDKNAAPRLAQAIQKHINASPST